MGCWRGGEGVGGAEVLTWPAVYMGRWADWERGGREGKKSTKRQYVHSAIQIMQIIKSIVILVHTFLLRLIDKNFTEF